MTIPDKLQRVLEHCPGIRLEGTDVQAIAGDNQLLTISFDEDLQGHATRLLASAVMRNRGLVADLSEDHTLACTCTEDQLREFTGYLDYGSTRHLGPIPAVRLGHAVGLSSLMSHVYQALCAEYDAERGAAAHLATWSNLLRIIGSGGMDQREVGNAAILAKRAVVVALKNAVTAGWIDSEKDPAVRGKTLLTLTDSGTHARTQAEQRLQQLEANWRSRFGDDTISALRSALCDIVATLPVEYPWYLSGYGPSDPRITGADQPPREHDDGIPGHGEQWPVVRRDNRNLDRAPLHALHAQALAAFTVDYEKHHAGWLSVTARCLASLSDDGTPLTALRDQGVTGAGKSLLERHYYLVAEPKGHSKTRRVFLTPKGRHARDAWPYLMAEVENTWRARYGDKTVSALRSALDAIDTGTPRADYPDVNTWFIPGLWGRPGT